jgi:hypothetical protein
MLITFVKNVFVDGNRYNGCFTLGSGQSRRTARPLHHYVDTVSQWLFYCLGYEIGGKEREGGRDIGELLLQVKKSR